MKNVGVPDDDIKLLYVPSENSEKYDLVHWEDLERRGYDIHGSLDNLIPCPDLSDLLDYLSFSFHPAISITQLWKLRESDEMYDTYWRASILDPRQYIEYGKTKMVEAKGDDALDAVYNLIIVLHSVDSLPHPDSEGQF